MIVLVLPYPPSVNNLYATFKGRRILSREGRAYHAAVGLAVNLQAKGCFDADERLGYILTVCPPDRRKRDLSNVVKAIEDALTKAGIWEDDSQVDALTVRRHPPIKGGSAQIRIESLPDAGPNTPHSFPRSATFEIDHELVALFPTERKAP